MCRASPQGESNSEGQSGCGPALRIARLRLAVKRLKLVGASAPAALLRHRYVEVEAALLQAVDEIERRPFQEQLALLIDHQVLAVVVVAAVLRLVVVVIEKQLVAVAAAAAGDDLHAEEHLLAGLGPFFMTLEFSSSFFGQRNRHGFRSLLRNNQWLCY